MMGMALTKETGGQSCKSNSAAEQQVMLGESPDLSGPLFSHLHPKALPWKISRPFPAPTHPGQNSHAVFWFHHSRWSGPEPLTCSDTISLICQMWAVDLRLAHSSSVKRVIKNLEMVGFHFDDYLFKTHKPNISSFTTI